MYCFPQKHQRNTASFKWVKWKLYNFGVGARAEMVNDDLMMRLDLSAFRQMCTQSASGLAL